MIVVLESKFYEMWANLFPKCKRSPWCDIPGKCDTCYEIDKLRRTEEKPKDFLKKRMYCIGGRLFKLERDTYVFFLFRVIMIFVLGLQVDAKKKIDSQQQGKNNVMSIIIDGMDQSHCKVPYLGTQVACFFNSFRCQ